MNLEAVVDPECDIDDYGFPAGAELLQFGTIANRAANIALDGDRPALVSELQMARRRLVESVGHQGLVEAAATIAAFNGLVRVADGTGIELDDAMVAASTDVRSHLRLDELAGAANTSRLDRIAEGAAGSRAAEPGVGSLFADLD